MKEKPILMSGPMVRALLDGTKTETRRVVKPQPKHRPILAASGLTIGADPARDGEEWIDADCINPGVPMRNPYGWGNLWVKETFALCESRSTDGHPARLYRATSQVEGLKWKPSIFMFRWASRITLEITEVRVERLHDIGKDGRKGKDVLAEGITEAQIEVWKQWLHPDDAPAHTYSVLWESINGKGSWALNPWVWVISFKRLAP